MAEFCPYCDEEIEDSIHREWVGDYLMNFEFVCPECGKTMEIDVEMEPVFLSHKKKAESRNETQNRWSQ